MPAVLVFEQAGSTPQRIAPAIETGDDWRHGQMRDAAPPKESPLRLKPESYPSKVIKSNAAPPKESPLRLKPLQ